MTVPKSTVFKLCREQFTNVQLSHSTSVAASTRANGWNSHRQSRVEWSATCQPRLRVYDVTGLRRVRFLVGMSVTRNGQSKSCMVSRLQHAAAERPGSPSGLSNIDASSKDTSDNAKTYAFQTTLAANERNDFCKCFLIDARRITKHSSFISWSGYTTLGP